jgi:hypothetical protein
MPIRTASSSYGRRGTSPTEYLGLAAAGPLRPSNFAFRVRVSRLRLELPVR